jgi:DNA invertase Pin-like site-specific DNA recombinase
MEDFKTKGIGLVSLHENIDTATPTGKFIFHLFGAFAEMERDIMRERTKAGLAAARARGRKGGRPFKYPQKKIAAAVKYANEHPEKKISEVCELFGISRSAFYKRSEG